MKGPDCEDNRPVEKEWISEGSGGHRRAFFAEGSDFVPVPEGVIPQESPLASSPSGFSFSGLGPSSLTRSLTIATRSSVWSMGPGALANALTWSHGSARRSTTFKLTNPGTRGSMRPLPLRRTSVVSDASSAFSADEDDDICMTSMINNECAAAMDHRHSAVSETNVEGVSSVNWQDADVQERLQEIQKITRQLFNAFEGAERESRQFSVKPMERWSTVPARILKLRKFAALSLILTIYALFGPDVALCLGQNSRYNEILASINTAVLAFFLSESALQYYALPGYACSGRFWVDILAAMSMIGDTLVGYEFLSSGTAAAGRGTRVLRMLRMGGRSSRFLRILKNVRLVQGIRVISKLFKYFDRDRQKLAMMLFKERLHRLFQYLDEGDKHYLSDLETEYFWMTLFTLFPPPRKGRFTWREWRQASLPQKASICFKWLQVSLSESLTKMLLWLSVRKVGRHSAIDTTLEDSERIVPDQTFYKENRIKTFASLLREFVSKAEAKVALKQCEEDLDRVERAADLFNETNAKLMLKVSLLVLCVLVVMPLLEVARDDKSDAQSLASLDVLSQDIGANGSPELCEIVRGYCESAEGIMLMLGLHRSTRWLASCTLAGCRIPYYGESRLNLLRRAERVMDDKGLQPHEYHLDCHPDLECPDNPRSLALFDVSKKVRERGVWNIVYTSVAVFLMLAFVIFFAGDLRTLKSRVLLPMWDLLDDMAAMKTLEFARARDLTNMGEYNKINSVSSSGLHPIWKGKHSCHPVAFLLGCCGSSGVEPEEITALKNAFTALRQATRSWAKYVPTTLVKRLVAAGLEARLCVMKKSVTILFIDVRDFDDLCKGLEPREVLMLLCHIQEAINNALEKNKGTLLEMIGDEMLAVFNAPLEVFDHPRLAIRAAIAATKAVQSLQDLPGLDIRLRCGINQAQVLAGNIGSERRLKYGVLGDGVNTTARLKSVNSQLESQILVTEHTLPELDDGEFLTRPAGHFILKGRSQCTKIWEVMGRTKDQSEKLIEVAAQHQKAFELYLDRKFEDARRLFAEAHWAFGSMQRQDVLSRRMMERCEECIRLAPPESGWDGVETLRKK